MKSLKEILDKLTPKDRATLFYAFDKGITQHIEYEPGRFIGVYVRPGTKFKVEQKVNDWVEGELNVPIT